MKCSAAEADVTEADDVAAAEYAVAVAGGAESIVTLAVAEQSDEPVTDDAAAEVATPGHSFLSGSVEAPKAGSETQGSSRFLRGQQCSMAMLPQTESQSSDTWSCFPCTSDVATLLVAHRNRTVQAEKRTKNSSGAGGSEALPEKLLHEVLMTPGLVESFVCCSCTVPYCC